MQSARRRVIFATGKRSTVGRRRSPRFSSTQSERPRGTPHDRRKGTMSEAVVQTRTAARRPLSGWIWFALMVGGWTTFFALVLFAEATLADVWTGLRDLPLVAEGIIWFLLFPLVLATAVWQSSWETWLRVGLVACFAIVWTIAFFPRK